MDAQVEGTVVKRTYRMKDALALAPMDQCVLPFRSPSREWWRYGWAAGFISMRESDCLYPVREKRFRTALSIGYLAGKKHREELDAGGVGA